MTVKKLLAQRRLSIVTDVADRRAASAVTARMLRSKLAVKALNDAMYEFAMELLIPNRKGAARRMAEWYADVARRKACASTDENKSQG